MGDSEAEAKPQHFAILRLVFILMVAIIAFGLPEVFAGTGRGWLIRPDVYVLGLPLYALHFILFAHIAIRIRRTSWPALYIFGVIFALYESWVTKVIWNGYPGDGGFAMGGFGEWFGVHETLGLLLFYHPVTSFLLPLAVISRLFPAYGKFFPVPDWLFGKTKTGLVTRIGLLLIWGIMSGHNMPVLADYLFSWIPMMVLIGAGYVFLKSKGATAHNTNVANIVASPLLGRWALIFASIWLALIYFVSYIKLLPEMLPPAHIQLITLAFYPVLFVILKIIAPRTPLAGGVEPVTSGARMPALWLLGIFVTGIVATFIVALGEPFRIVLATPAFLAMVPIGVWLFLWVVLWKSVIRKPQASSSSSS